MADTATPGTATPSEPDLAGRQVGDYHLLRRLGRGGMAEVYLAEQLSLKRQVAFKVLKRSLAGDPSYVRRFVNEAQAAASLVHANIVQIYEVGCKEGIHFIAQEYVAGQNLRQYLTRRKSLTPRETAAVMLQVGAALTVAAEKGIVHRDIKPENIMLSTKGEVKVADFGLARMANDAVNLTQVGVTMGTPLYMSPEQVEGKSIDHRSDLYSLGVTAYQMLAGRPPFEGENALAVAVQHLKTEPPRLQTLRADVPPGMCRIVHQLLAKDPAKRYAHPADLVRDLRSTAEPNAAEGFSGPIDAAGSFEGLTSANARWEATQRLETIMHQEAAPAARLPRWWHVALALVIALVLGGVLARATRREPLLAVNPAERPAVKRMESASAQYYYAVSLNTPKAYESVGEYFPQDEYYRLRSKQRLAELYLREEKLDQALKVCDELTTVDPANEQFRLIGYVGRTIVYGRKQDQAKVLENLAPLATKEASLPNLTPAWIDELRAIQAKVNEGRK